MDGTPHTLAAGFTPSDRTIRRPRWAGSFIWHRFGRQERVALGGESGDPGELIVATQAQLAALLGLVDEVVVAFDVAGNVRFVNRAVKATLGYEPSSLVGTNAVELMHPDDLELFVQGWSPSLRRAGVGGQQPERRLKHADGSWVTFAIDFFAGEDVAPFGAAVATLRPVDRTTAVERELRERLANEDRLVKLTSTFVGTPVDQFDAGVEAMLFQLGSLNRVGRASLLVRDGEHVALTHEFSALRSEQFLDSLAPMPIAASPFLQQLAALREVHADVLHPDHAGMPFLDAVRADGFRSVLAAPVVEDGTFTGVIAFSSTDAGALQQTSYRSMLRSATAILAEASARRRAEQKLAFEARTDSLTGLGNRWAFAEAIADALDAYRDGSGPGFSVLLLDLDRFKVVNDSLGHLVGDQLLRAVAGRLQAVTRPHEVLARFGGDEIVMLLGRLGHREAALERAQEIVDVLNDPFEVGSHEFSITVSGGLAVAGRGLDGDELLRRADAAMFRAKDRGRRRTEVFDDCLLAEVNERLEHESDLQRAVREGQLLLHYQPEVDLASGVVIGCEALLRWQHPTRGLLDAGSFIYLAEESGSIVEIGSWVLAETCRQIARWQEQGVELAVRANLSARQINQSDLVLRLIEILAETDIDPSTLCLEVTETAVMADTELSQEVLTKLNGLGIRLAVDDFGTGYSSLAQLTRFPVNILKIDRSFVSDLRPGGDAAAIIRAILSLAESLGMDTVAEGVETDAQRGQLLELGCRRAQGFLFSRAIPPADLVALLAGPGLLP